MLQPWLTDQQKWLTGMSCVRHQMTENWRGSIHQKLPLLAPWTTAWSGTVEVMRNRTLWNLLRYKLYSTVSIFYKTLIPSVYANIYYANGRETLNLQANYSQLSQLHTSIIFYFQTAFFPNIFHEEQCLIWKVTNRI